MRCFCRSLANRALLPALSLSMMSFRPAHAELRQYLFTYTNRAALLADGWGFIASDQLNWPYFMVTRNTETTNGAVISYDQVAHPGVLRIPVDSGDLWAGYNNSRNTLFHSLPPNWVSARLTLAFWPTQANQQISLLLYQDDDNYAGVYYAFGPSQRITFTQEIDANPYIPYTVPVRATNLWFRLDRDLLTENLTGLYSLDGSNWVTLGQLWEPLLNPQLAIFAGGSPGGLPNADLREMDVFTADTLPAPVLIAQPQHLVFNSLAGQPYTNRQQVRIIAHRTPTSVAWSVSSDSPWLNTSVVASNTPGTVDISVNTAGLGADIYQGNLVFSAAGAGAAFAKVTLIVNPAGRASVATWRGGKSGAMTVKVDDSFGTAFDDLSTNGYAGTYNMWHTVAPSFYSNYYRAGMELGSHTVAHPCYPVSEMAIRFEIQTNIAGLFATSPERPEELVSFSWPCGVTSIIEEIAASDYFLLGYGYNFNQLENTTPYDFMNLKSFNSHEHDPHQFNPSAPPNPTDLKTIVDAAIAQGKWFMLALHATNDDDGAIVYSVGKDIWVAPGGTVIKYIMQRDRTVITNYLDGPGGVQFDFYRLPVEPSSWRSFETAFGPKDTVTFQVDVSGLGAVASAALNGVPVPYTTRLFSGRTLLLFNASVSAALQRTTVLVSPGSPGPFRITGVSLSNGVPVITWDSVAGQSYHLQFSQGTAGTNWLEAAPPVTATGLRTSATDTNSYGQERIYRLLLAK